MRSTIVFALVTIALSMILFLTVSAEIPHLITYQGRLTDPAGNPVNDSSYQVIFTIYNMPDAGDALWTSGVQDIDVGDGLFSYPLGIHVPLHDSIFSQNMELWLGVQIGADPEMTPRPMLTSGPYVYHALHANVADHSEAAGWTEHAVHADTAEYAHAGPSGGLTLPYSGTTANAATAFAVSNTGSGSGPALRGSSDENDGVVGWTDLAGKSGVYGFSTAGNGVSGRTQGDGYGGHFTAEGSSGTAVYATAPGGGMAGDFNGDVNINSGGLNASDNGTAGNFYSSEFSASDSGVIYARYDGSVFSSFLPSAISGFCLPSEGYGGVGGYFQSNGVGVQAQVYRGTIDADAVGFMAYLSYGGPNATNTGFDAHINGQNVRANIGLNVDASGADGENYGAIIRADDAMGLTHALRNTGTYTVSYYGDTCTAMHAYANSGDSVSIGVRSEAYWSSTTYGGHFYAHSAGDNYGLYAESMLGEKNYGIYAKAPTGLLDYAGYFDGDVKVTGGLWATAKYFQIDHPLDPANKYLNHACVESSDMMNIYNGNVVTDSNGLSRVTLPNYMVALNTDFRYQLTVIGQFAQAIIAEEISGNEFVIRTDKPRVKVSWQITGIRNDAAARLSRRPVEMEKPESEKGTYQNPKAFGLSEEFGVHYQMQKKARLSNSEDAVRYQSAVERRQADQTRRP